MKRMCRIIFSAVIFAAGYASGAEEEKIDKDFQITTLSNGWKWTLPRADRTDKQSLHFLQKDKIQVSGDLDPVLAPALGICESPALVGTSFFIANGSLILISADRVAADMNGDGQPDYLLTAGAAAKNPAAHTSFIARNGRWVKCRTFARQSGTAVLPDGSRFLLTGSGWTPVAADAAVPAQNEAARAQREAFRANPKPAPDGIRPPHPVLRQNDPAVRVLAQKNGFTAVEDGKTGEIGIFDGKMCMVYDPRSQTVSSFPMDSKHWQTDTASFTRSGTAGLAVTERGRRLQDWNQDMLFDVMTDPAGKIYLARDGRWELCRTFDEAKRTAVLADGSAWRWTGTGWTPEK